MGHVPVRYVSHNQAGYLFPSLDQGRLFVKNLPYDASEDDIAKLFAKCGKVAMDPWCVSAARCNTSNSRGGLIVGSVLKRS